MTPDLHHRSDLIGELGASDDLGAIRFRKERDAGDVINVTFRFLRDNLRELGLGALYIVGPVALAASGLSFVVQSRMQSSMFDFTNMSDDPFELYASILTPAYAGYLFLLVVVQVLISAVVLAYVSLYRKGMAGEISPGLLWAEASGMIWPIIGLSLFMGLLVVVSVIVWIIPCLGALAWLAALVYLIPTLSMAPVARVLEVGGAFGALKRPYELVKGNWGMSFGTVIIALIAFFAVAALLSIPSALISFGTAMGSLTPADPGAGSRVLMAIGSVLGTLSYVGYAIPIVAASFLYFNLVERKEGTGLFSDIDLIADSIPAAESDPAGAPPVRPPTSASEEPTNPPDEWGFRGGGFGDRADR